MCYYFDDVMEVQDINVENEKSYENILVYNLYKVYIKVYVKFYTKKL